MLAHAVTDALLGAAGLEDIGHYFPDTEDRYKNADSIELLIKARKLLGTTWEVSNVDAVVICERPKIRDHRDGMRESLACALGVEFSRVGVRGTTTERLGFPGRGEGIAAQAVCLLEAVQSDGERGPGTVRPEPDRFACTWAAPGPRSLTTSTPGTPAANSFCG